MVWRGELPEDGLAGFWHHGILCGDGSVVHYGGMDGKKTFKNARILRTTVEEFKSNRSRSTHTVNYPATRKRFSPEEAEQRAISQIGQRDYHLIFRNCETFSRWCVTGEQRSFQVQGAAVGFAGAIAALACGGSPLGAVLTAVVTQKVWDNGRNRSDSRPSIAEDAYSQPIRKSPSSGNQDAHMRDSW